MKSEIGMGVILLFWSLLPKVMLPARISEADLMFWAVTGDVFDAGGLKAWRTMVNAKEMSV